MNLMRDSAAKLQNIYHNKQQIVQNFRNKYRILKSPVNKIHNYKEKNAKKLTVSNKNVTFAENN